MAQPIPRAATRPRISSTPRSKPQDDEEAVVAEALSVEGGVLRFKLLV